MRVIRHVAVAMLLFPLSLGCGKGNKPSEGGSEPGRVEATGPENPAASPRKWDEWLGDESSFDVGDYKGKVLIVELGSVGCRMTGSVYEKLLEYNRSKPPQVEIVRIDWGQSVKDTRSFYEKNRPAFRIVGDPDGSIGNTFDTQAMPTVFIFGKWGKLRYHGGWDDSIHGRIVQPLIRERKVDGKNFFLKKSLSVGDPFPHFKLKDFLSGEEYDTEEAARESTVFAAVFVDLCCPVCTNAVKFLKDFYSENSHNGLAMILVDSEDSSATARAKYDDMELGFPVLTDPDKQVWNSLGLDAVPTVFVVEPDGKIAFRSLWNEIGVRENILVSLGLLSEDEMTEGASDSTGAA